MGGGTCPSSRRTESARRPVTTGKKKVLQLSGDLHREGGIVYLARGRKGSWLASSSEKAEWGGDPFIQAGKNSFILAGGYKALCIGEKGQGGSRFSGKPGQDLSTNNNGFSETIYRRRRRPLLFRQENPPLKDADTLPRGEVTRQDRFTACSRATGELLVSSSACPKGGKGDKITTRLSLRFPERLSSLLTRDRGGEDAVPGRRAVQEREGNPPGSPEENPVGVLGG